jgi:hypothetical protein
MFAVLIASLAISDSSIPKWMAFKDPDHLSAQDKNRPIVSACGSASVCCCQTSLTHAVKLRLRVRKNLNERPTVTARLRRLRTAPNFAKAHIQHRHHQPHRRLCALLWNSMVFCKRCRFNMLLNSQRRRRRSCLSRKRRLEPSYAAGINWWWDLILETKSFVSIIRDIMPWERLLIMTRAGTCDALAMNIKSTGNRNSSSFKRILI